MKKILAIAALLSLTIAANAQTTTSAASQTANLALSDAIEITYTGSAKADEAAVNFTFNGVNDFANGIESGVQELKVRSNKKFNVSAKASAGTFTYTGATTPAPTMFVFNTLGLIVTNNGTGGSVPIPFSMSNYFGLTTLALNIITNGLHGGDQRFSVKYKAAPGWSFPAGNYAVDVIYTATQQ